MSSQPQRPWRHHYVPKFYLNRWRNPDRHWVLRWQGDRLLPPDLYAPRQAGNLANLYRVGSDETMLFDGETQVMGALDDRAAPIISKLVDERKPPGRKDWLMIVRFLWALAARNPATQQILLSGMPALLESVADECAGLGIDHDALRKMFENEKIGPPALQLAIINQIEAADNPIAAMPCEILIFPDPLLVTSHYPLVSLPRIDAPKALHLVALAPDMALVFSRDGRLREMLRRANSKMCATTINQLIALSSDTIIGKNKETVLSVQDHLDGWKRNPGAAQLAEDALKRLAG